MSQPAKTTAVNVLNGLQMLRSPQAEERKRGIAELAGMRDDPRVMQVFEHLYRTDPDASVREHAWRAMNAQSPAVPTPGPALEARADELKAEAGSDSRPPATAARRPPSRTVFLLNPANARVLSRMQRQRQRPRGRLSLWLAGVVLLIVGVFWGLVLPDWLDWARLERSGTAVEGTITDLTARDVSGSRRYYVAYSFTPKESEGGPSYTHEQQITVSAYTQLRPDTPIMVTYLPDDLSVSRTSAKNPQDIERERDTILAGALTVLLILLLILVAIQRRRPSAPLRDKRLVRGLVLACTGQTDADGDFYIKLRYRFRGPSGQKITGQAGRIRNDLKRKPLPAPGTPVAVYYKNKKSHHVL